MITISEILKGSDYNLTQFSNDKIIKLENSIIEKDVKGKITPYINCIVRGKEIKLTPEEIVRQLYLMVLTEDYHYPASRMELEYIVTFGREKKRADIVIFEFLFSPDLKVFITLVGISMLSKHTVFVF